MGDNADIQKMKELLQSFSQDQLTDKNNFDVLNLHKLLQTFPSAELEEALAEATKSAYTNILGLLARSAEDVEDKSLTPSQLASANAYNAEIKDTVDVFLGLMNDDRWNSTTAPSNHTDAFGIRTSKGNMNAFESVLCMAFGGVNGTAPSASVPIEQARAHPSFTSIRADAVTTSTGADDTNISLVGQESRAVYLVGLWAKHGMADAIFGSGARQIVVRQTSNTASGACAQSYCGKYNIQEEVRTYNLWDNSEKGRNQFVSVLGSLVATSMTDSSTKRSSGKLLGGEDAFNTTILNTLVADEGKFEMEQHGAVLRSGSSVSTTMTIHELNTAFDLGYKEVSHLGISFGTGADNSLAGKTTAQLTAEWSSDFKIGSRINVGNRVNGTLVAGTTSIATPYLTNVLGSKYRDEFITGALLQSDKLNTINDALSTATLIASYGVENKQLKESYGLGTETRTRESQIVNAGFLLVNEAREIAGKPKFASLRELLEDHDNAGRASATGLFNTICSTSTWGDADTLHSNSSKKTLEGQTIFEEIVYNNSDDYTTLDNDTLSKTSADLIPNKYFEKNQRNVIQKLVGKVLKANFIENTAQFLHTVLPKNLAHMKMPAHAYNAVTGQTEANIHAAFDEGASSTPTTYGQVFDGHGIEDIATDAKGYLQKNALVYHFMLSLLTSVELEAFLKKEGNAGLNGSQVAILLKFTKEETDLQNVFTPGYFTYASGSADRKVRSGSVTGAWIGATADVTQSDIIALTGILNKDNHGAIFTKDADKAHKEKARDAIMDSISNQHFNLQDPTNKTLLEFRLQLANSLVVSAINVQKIAGDKDDVYDFANTTPLTSILDLDDAAVIPSTSAYKKYENKVFVSVAFMSIAKAAQDNAASPVSFYNNTANDVSNITVRDLNLIEIIENALADANYKQKKEFYFKVIAMAAATGVTVPKSLAYQKLAKSIKRQLALELIDPVGGDHNLLKGWATTRGGSFTAVEERSILAALISDIQGAEPLTKPADTAGKTNHLASIQGLSNIATNGSAVDYDIAHTAAYAGRTVLQLAKIACGLDANNDWGPVYNDKATALKNFADEVSGAYEKMIALYMAALLFEDPSKNHGLYDSDEFGAGIGQAAVTALLQSGIITQADLRKERHVVEVEEEGTSYTNHAVKLEGHTFVAIVNGTISVCTGVVDGKCVYEALDISKKPLN